ncbi:MULTISPECIES: glycerol dehydrogenase [Paenibacillus]|uniref:Glycerol dehydrogenase n=1 Tax=Paenibacillus phytohabitans TaxID=2654978 RepID=A0ABX1YR28_9BACL|nr:MULTISPECIES: glycerol dehydrogenase [Paenibacillus]NOU83358.1 iron-containing alcohol dehydrogenase [Paenibacillus phytohabitans]OMF32681.1 glycerol dehydrogenase [Paenibacillus sp. FSL H8-0259]
MRKILTSPSKYVQGKDELYNIGDYVTIYGRKALLVAHKDDQARVQDYLDKAVAKGGFEFVTGGFGGECTLKEIGRLEQFAAAEGCDVIVGLGGGKALDTAKAIANRARIAIIVVPTIAATDAPCSGSSVIYSEHGEFESYLYARQNPNVVLVDTGIIANAPTRFLVAGMGDALSTFFEARSCVRGFTYNNSGAVSTKAAMELARLCYETLLEDGLKAKAANDSKVVTQALENIIETNILLSGLGFESGGLAAAHAVHNGLTILEETHHYYHGEKVAFGTLVHMVLENAPQEELDTVLGFCKSLGLPTCLKDLGVTDISEARLMPVAERACAEGESIHNMPFPVTKYDVYAAILAADRLGGSGGEAR